MQNLMNSGAAEDDFSHYRRVHTDGLVWADFSMATEGLGSHTHLTTASNKGIPTTWFANPTTNQAMPSDPGRFALLPTL